MKELNKVIICIQFVAVSNRRGSRIWIQGINDIIFNDQKLYGGKFCYICTAPKSVVF